jgi:hypothetical protein
MNPSDQLQLINDAINKTKEQLKPTSVNFIFWGILITFMSCIHLSFPNFIQSSRYSSLIFWTVLPAIGMVMTIIYNFKVGVKKGYETHLGRALKIIWGVFYVAWMAIAVISAFKRQNPVEDILFLLGIVLLISAFIIRFKPLIIGGALVLSCSILLTLKPDLNPLLINAIAAFSGLFMPGLTLFLKK